MKDLNINWYHTIKLAAHQSLLDRLAPPPSPPESHEGWPALTEELWAELTAPLEPAVSYGLDGKPLKK